jgi:hypothetical protein
MRTSRIYFTFAATLFLAMLCAQPAGAVPVVVDFDQFTGMDFAPDEPIAESARLADQLMPSLGVRFSSGSPYVAVVNMGPGHAVSGLNAIAGSTPEGLLTYDRSYPIEISFCQPGNPSVPAVTNFVSIQGDLWGNGQPITLNAFDVNGKIIGSATATDTGGTLLEVSAAGINRVQFLGTTNDGGVACDNLTFNPTVYVPTPASAILASLGAGLVAAIRRWRKL